MSDTGVRPAAGWRDRIQLIAERDFMLVVLLAAFGIVFLTIFPPTLLVADTWMTLLSGREIVDHGLPTREELTVLGLGRTWTDQQWGAQLLAYGAHSLGGHGLLAVVAGAFALTAFALAAIGARSLGAGPRAVVLLFFPVLMAAPWTFTVRAQVFALPFYTGALWLLASEARRPTRRVYLIVPLLVVWGNIHGSASLGAMLTMLLGATELFSPRLRARSESAGTDSDRANQAGGGRSWLRSGLLLVLPPLALLATPYGPVTTARYYHLLLVDPPFGRELVTEWQRSTPSWKTLVFYLLAALAVAVVVWGRRRLTLFDIGTLAITFVGAVVAIRGIPWFALACLVLLPVAIGRTLEGRVPRVRRKLDGVLSYVAVGALGLVAVLALFRSESWYLKEWPGAALVPVREVVTTEPESRVFATSRDADWVLWRIPELRGRLAYDVRFEIYDRATFERIVRFRGEQGTDWKSLADGYDVIVLETHQEPSSHVEDFLEEPGARAAYQDDRITVVLRPRRAG